MSFEVRPLEGWVQRVWQCCRAEPMAAAGGQMDELVPYVRMVKGRVGEGEW